MKECPGSNNDGANVARPSSIPKIAVAAGINEDSDTPAPGEAGAETRRDVWEISGDWVFRRHLLPRTKLLDPRCVRDTPRVQINLYCTTNLWVDDGRQMMRTDRWQSEQEGQRDLDEQWVGVTKFKIIGDDRDLVEPDEGQKGNREA